MFNFPGAPLLLRKLRWDLHQAWVFNTAKKEWGVGELEFEALMRMLDNSGYRTGHTYVEPLVRKEPAKMISDVELPPTASNLGYLMDEEELYKDGPLRVR